MCKFSQRIYDDLSVDEVNGEVVCNDKHICHVDNREIFRLQEYINFLSVVIANEVSEERLKQYDNPLQSYPDAPLIKRGYRIPKKKFLWFYINDFEDLGIVVGDHHDFCRNQIFLGRYRGKIFQYCLNCRYITEVFKP